MSVYSLDKQDRESIDGIFSNLNQLQVVDEYKKALSEMTDKACDELTNYLQDEYVLRFEEIVMRKAKKAVEALLRGEELEHFGLRITKNLHGKDAEYDFGHVRQSLVRDFKEEIQNAEILHLQEENKRLTDSLEFHKRRERY